LSDVNRLVSVTEAKGGRGILPLSPPLVYRIGEIMTPKDIVQDAVELYHDLKGICGLDCDETFVEMHVAEGFTAEQAKDMLNYISGLSSELIRIKHRNDFIN
jgi:hypothetical protein